MALSVFTNSQIISLDDSSQDIFMNYILTPDANNQIQAVQTYAGIMMTKAIALRLQPGIDEVTKKMILAALADLKPGDRFLCNRAVIKDIDSPEAKYYLRIVGLMNDGKNRTPQQAQNEARDVEKEFDIVTMPGT